MATPKDLTFLDDISPIDWARLAAFIDGEGCIRIATVKGNKTSSRRVMYVEVTITNTDVRLVEWLARTFGGNSVCSRRAGLHQNWSQCFAWSVSSRHATALIEHALPYFIIKREQANVALAFQATILPGRPYGRSGRPAELVAQQETYASQLSAMKGLAAQRGRRKSTVGETVQ